MVEVFEGKLESKGLKVAIIASRFNDFMSGKLLEGALDALKRTGSDENDLSVYKVPGAYEVPLMAAKLAATKKFDGIVCLESLSGGNASF